MKSIFELNINYKKIAQDRYYEATQNWFDSEKDFTVIDIQFYINDKLNTIKLETNKFAQNGLFSKEIIKQISKEVQGLDFSKEIKFNISDSDPKWLSHKITIGEFLKAKTIYELIQDFTNEYHVPSPEEADFIQNDRKNQFISDIYFSCRD